ALPHLVLGWKAGGFASRFGTLKTVVWMDLVRGLIFVVPALGWSSLPASCHIPALFVLVLLSNTAAALFNPAILSLPASLCEESNLSQLTAAVDSCFSAGTVIGPVLAAVLYPWLGLRGLLLFNGLSYFLSAILEASVPVREGGMSAAHSGSASRGAIEVLQADG